MRRIALQVCWGLSVILVAGCAQPEVSVDVQAPEETPEAMVAGPAEESADSNDILSVPAEPEPPPPPPVTTAKPLPPSQYAAKPAAQPRVHVVQPKETLYSISRRYYGHGRHWRRIFQANNNRIVDPNQIEVGMKLIIP